MSYPRSVTQRINAIELLHGVIRELDLEDAHGSRIKDAIKTIISDLQDDDGTDHSPACDCGARACSDGGDEAAFFAELDKRLAELDAIAHRALDAGPDANSCYWISDDGVIHDVEVHSGVVSFDLACRIAAHNATMRAAK